EPVRRVGRVVDESRFHDGSSRYVEGVYPVVNSRPRRRQAGSRLSDPCVNRLSAWMALPYVMTACDESSDPGGWSMNGMNLSGKPGIVQPMQIPPTFGQPPMPLIQPRLGTLHFTTGPQHPSFTMHFGEPYSEAKSPCS